MNDLCRFVVPVSTSESVHLADAHLARIWIDSFSLIIILVFCVPLPFLRGLFTFVSCNSHKSDTERHVQPGVFLFVFPFALRVSSPVKQLFP